MERIVTTKAIRYNVVILFGGWQFYKRVQLSKAAINQMTIDASCNSKFRNALLTDPIAQVPVASIFHKKLRPIQVVIFLLKLR